MQIYCKNCKKHTGNTSPKKLVPISKNITKEKIEMCLSDCNWTRTQNHRYDLESKVKVFYPKFFTDRCYKRKWRIIA